MKTKFIPLFFAIALTACTVDYNMKPTVIDEPNRIVVNSLLNPEHPISVYFHTIDRTNTGFVYNTAANLHVKLVEDDLTLFDGLCTDTALVLNQYPKANAKYRIDVSLPGYEPVWAETTVPSAVTCKASAEEFGRNERVDNITEMKYFLSGFEGNYGKENTSLYIVVSTVHGGDTIVQSGSLYASNVLLDPMNRSNGIEVKDKDVGSAYYEYFMRVGNRNITYLDNLIFVTYMTHEGYYEDDNPGYYDYDSGRWVPPIWIPYEGQKYNVKLITAGTDYDMYWRTYYQQTTYNSYDDEISGIFYQPIPVYSNINGGLGIFAGMNESNHFFDPPKPSGQDGTTLNE